MKTEEVPDDTTQTNSSMNPEEAASFAAGDGDTSPTASSKLVSRLFDGRASGPSVQEVQADYGADRGIAVFLRGLIRASTGDGIPPIGEICLGPALWILSRRASEETDTDDAEGDDGARQDEWGELDG